MQVTVQNNQSLFDIAIQYTGTAETAFEIARANDCSITSNLSGVSITIPSHHPNRNERVVKIIASEKLSPASYPDGVGANTPTIINSPYTNQSLSTQ